MHICKPSQNSNIERKHPKPKWLSEKKKDEEKIYMSKVPYANAIGSLLCDVVSIPEFSFIIRIN